MKRLIALGCSLVTVFGVWALSAAAAMYDEGCVVDTVTLGNVVYESEVKHYDEMMNEWTYAEDRTVTWSCTEETVAAVGCAPCIYLQMEKWGTIDGVPGWWSMTITQSTGDLTPVNCGESGTHTLTHTFNHLPANSYRYRVAYGTPDPNGPDDSGCGNFFTWTAWDQFSVP